jgi:predicted DNA-binding protein with PD1-like motif
LRVAVDPRNNLIPSARTMYDGDRMEVERKDEVLFVRLEHDEDILGSVGEMIALEHSTLVFTAGLGMIHDFELGYFDNGQYIRKRYKEPHELLSVQGSVSTDGEPRIHLHVTVADKAHAAFGGHLLSGKAWMSNELVLLTMAGVRSHRMLDPELKVGVLHFMHGAED